MKGFIITLPFVMLLTYSFRFDQSYSRGHSTAISLFNSFNSSFRSLQIVGTSFTNPFSYIQLGRKRPVMVLWPQSISPVSILFMCSPERSPYMYRMDLFGMHFKMVPVILPPMASQQMRAFIFKANSFNFYSKSASLELRIWLAPSFFNNSTCYSRRTMFIICTPSGGKNLFNILPKEEAAALTITVFIFFDSAISSIAIAVKGFTKLIEACSKLILSSTGRHQEDFAKAYCAQDPELISGVKATFLLTSPQPTIPPPFSITTPLPQNPATQGAFFTVEQVADLRKYTSEGLMGAAMTLIKTSPS